MAGWYVSVERFGFTPVKIPFTLYTKAKAEYKSYNHIPDSDSNLAEGRVWLCRADGCALDVSYFRITNERKN